MSWLGKILTPHKYGYNPLSLDPRKHIPPGLPGSSGSGGSGRNRDWHGAYGWGPVPPPGSEVPFTGPQNPTDPMPAPMPGQPPQWQPNGPFGGFMPSRAPGGWGGDRFVNRFGSRFGQQQGEPDMQRPWQQRWMDNADGQWNNRTGAYGPRMPRPLYPEPDVGHYADPMNGYGGGP